MFNAIIFDFDGVILNSEPIHFQAYCELLRPHGITLSEEEYCQHYLGLTDKELIPKIFRHHSTLLNEADIPFLIEAKLKIYVDLIQTIQELPLIEGVEEFLLAAESKIPKLGICSGSMRPEILAVLDRACDGKLKSLFDCIISSEDIRVGKPSPEGYLKAANALGVDPSTCLAIEDTPNGISAARAANLKTFGLLTSYSDPAYLGADRTFFNFHEIAQVLW